MSLFGMLHMPQLRPLSLVSAAAATDPLAQEEAALARLEADLLQQITEVRTAQQHVVPVGVDPSKLPSVQSLEYNGIAEDAADDGDDRGASDGFEQETVVPF